RSTEISPTALPDESVKAVATRASDVASRIFSSRKPALDGFAKAEVIGIDVSQILKMGLSA
ncbi:MAG: hypothetical protein JOY75_23565, partial [Hyphomicrobiales bacterium]|nr:hypothetical protein [Hyphomicrobiales bacterium]